MRLRVMLANRKYLVRSVATLKYREELTFDGRLIVFVLAYGFFYQCLQCFFCICKVGLVWVFYFY